MLTNAFSSVCHVMRFSVVLHPSCWFCESLWMYLVAMTDFHRANALSNTGSSPETTCLWSARVTGAPTAGAGGGRSSHDPLRRTLPSQRRRHAATRRAAPVPPPRRVRVHYAAARGNCNTAASLAAGDLTPADCWRNVFVLVRQKPQGCLFCMPPVVSPEVVGSPGQMVCGRVLLSCC